MRDNIEVVIPFDGFYSTVHEDVLNYALETEVQYLREEEVPEEIIERVENGIDWGAMRKAYYTHYVGYWAAALTEKIGVMVTIETPELNSPREYNFRNDRIFARMDYDGLLSVLSKVRADEALNKDFLKMAREMFTSHSGFISFYNPDPSTWGSPETWDYNQWGCLLQSLVPDIGAEWAYYCCEAARQLEYDETGRDAVADAYAWREARAADLEALKGWNALAGQTGQIALRPGA